MTKHLAHVKKRLKSLLLEIPNPCVLDQARKVNAPTLLTAGDVRYREDKDQPPYKTQLRESWLGLPVQARDNSEDRKDHRAVELKLPPPHGS